MSRKKLLATTLGALLAAASLAGCAESETEPTTASATPAATAPATTDAQASEAHNDADTTFAQMMIVHHEGAIEMAELAIDKAENPDVVELAEKIISDQEAEITEMKEMLAG